MSDEHVYCRACAEPFLREALSDRLLCVPCDAHRIPIYFCVEPEFDKYHRQPIGYANSLEEAQGVINRLLRVPVLLREDPGRYGYFLQAKFGTWNGYGKEPTPITVSA